MEEKVKSAEEKENAHSEEISSAAVFDEPETVDETEGNGGEAECGDTAGNAEEKPEQPKRFTFKFPKKITKKQARNATLRLTLTALFTALVIVATFYIQIPTGVGGYANLGDAVIFMCALSLGGIPALVAGGIGSMAADLILGYTAYAPFTLIVKGLEGLMAGLLCMLAEKKIKKKQFRIAAEIGALTASALWMVFGYFLVKWLILGDLEHTAIAAALIEVPFNLAQGGISVALAAVSAFVKGIVPKDFSSRNS